MSANACNQCDACYEFLPSKNDPSLCADVSCGHHNRVHFSSINNVNTPALPVSSNLQPRPSTSSSDTDVEIISIRSSVPLSHQRSQSAVHTSQHLDPAGTTRRNFTDRASSKSQPPQSFLSEIRQETKRGKSKLPDKGDNRSGRKTVNDDHYRNSLRRLSSTTSGQQPQLQSMPPPSAFPSRPFQVTIRLYTCERSSNPVHLPQDMRSTWDRSTPITSYTLWLQSVIAEHDAWIERTKHIHFDDQPLTEGRTGKRELRVSGVIRVC